MKKLLVLFCLISFATKSNLVQAQNTKKLNFGLGIDYGSEVEEAGLDLRVGYFLTDQINLVFDMNFFFFNDLGRFVKKRYWNEYNFNVHYYFPIRPREKESIFSPYGLAGLNISSFGIKYDKHPVFGNNETSNSKLGINIGGGADFNISTSLKPFIEIKYLLIENSDQGELALGIKYLFD